jgi:hypothetical protein
MIRIEGIPIVAARLAAAIKSAKSIQASRPVRQHRIRSSQGPKASTTVRVRRLASAPVAA